MPIIQNINGSADGRLSTLTRQVSSSVFLACSPDLVQTVCVKGNIRTSLFTLLTTRLTLTVRN